MYWISTASREGRPHAAPIWGVWKRNSFYFETDPGSVKGRNLMENHRVVVHVQDGLDTVILEGTAKREKNPEVLQGLPQDCTRLACS